MEPAIAGSVDPGSMGGPPALHLAFLGLGSNIGDRLANLRAGLSEMERAAGPATVSRAYETSPVGPVDQPDFLNAACLIRTTLGPSELLGAMQAAEAGLGRTRTVPGGPRTLDLDLLLYDDMIIREPGLTVPHPRMGQRAFVLVPLVEIAPWVVDPVSGLSAAEMLDGLPRPLGVGRSLPVRA